MSYDILDLWTGAVLFHAVEATDISSAALAALAARADLTRANLTDADLTRANLTDADLTDVRDDIYAILSSSPNEAQAVADALLNGRVDGHLYDGPCCCLVGTIAAAKSCSPDRIEGLVPDANRPAERWFLAISPGDTPDNSQIVKITHEWVRGWIEKMKSAFGG